MARSELLTNPKFRALVRLLGLPMPYVVGLLEVLWQTGYAQADPLIGSPEDVELAAEWPGKPGKLFAILSAKGWVDEVSPGQWSIHDFEEHAPDHVKKRMNRAMERRNKELQRNTADNGGQWTPNGGQRRPMDAHHTLPYLTIQTPL